VTRAEGTASRSPGYPTAVRDRALAERERK
jgi:hypothetical protein